MINYIETHIVDHCNLKCKGCSHFSGLAQPYFKDLTEYQKEMEQLSKITNQGVNIIRVMGGEPLLHPQYLEFLKVTRKYFPYSTIVLVSNGILLHNLEDKDIQTMNELNIELCVSDYGIKLDYEKFNKFNKRYFHSKNYMYNISLDLTGAQDNEHSFKNCDLVQGGWYFFKNGRMYQCCIMANIDYFCSHFNKDIHYYLDDISIDIFKHTEEEIKDFLSKPHDICKYCNTIERKSTYQPFEISKQDIKEWIM